MATKTAYPASEKQLAFVRKLLAERDWSDFAEDTLSDALTVQAGGSIAGKYASGLIDLLLARPRASTPASQPSASSEPLTEGIYIAPSGDIVKVKKSKTGNLYSQVAVHINGERLTLTDEVVNFDYVYTPGLTKHLTPAMRMTEAQAEAFALRTGRCAWCKKHLKAAKSVAQGIGPVCIKRFQ